MPGRLKTVAIASMFALLISGCTSTSQNSSETVNTNLEAEVTQAFLKIAEQSEAPGAFLLVRTPEGEFTAAYGTAVQGETVKPTADTHFRIGSNTKTMTGTLILQLIDEGLVSLEDPISKYRDDVPRGEDITIEMLLNMRSGLYPYNFDTDFLSDLGSDLSRAWRAEEVLPYSFRHELSFEPGTQYEYSNTNTVLLGLVAEQVTGESLRDLFASRLFEPLQLANTALPETSDTSLPAPHANGYNFFEPTDELPSDITNMNPSWGGAAGAVISTPTDLATWVEALAEGELLSTDLQKQRMDSFQPTDLKEVQYGLGMARLYELYGHAGDIPGFNSYMGADPERGVTVVIWVNVNQQRDESNPALNIASTIVPMLLADR